MKTKKSSAQPGTRKAGTGQRGKLKVNRQTIADLGPSKSAAGKVKGGVADPNKTKDCCATGMFCSS